MSIGYVVCMYKQTVRSSESEETTQLSGLQRRLADNGTEIHFLHSIFATVRSLGFILLLQSDTRIRRGQNGRVRKYRK